MTREGARPEEIRAAFIQGAYKPVALEPR